MTIRLPEQEKAIDYGLVYLLAAISGMPFFNGDIPLLGVFGLAFLIFLLRREGFHGYFFYILFAFLVLVLIHSLRFNYFPKNTYIGLAVKLSVGYLVIALVKNNFTKYYVDIICFFAAVSFIFFIPLLISDSFDTIFNAIGVSPPFEGGERKSLLFYQLNLDRPEGLYRNCGPFWEPAAFGGYLLLALMFNLSRNKGLGDRQSIILIVTLVSTFSTTVYLLLSILLFFYIVVRQTMLVKVIMVPIMVALFSFAFYQLTFLSEKIENEVEDGGREDVIAQTGSGHTRYSSALADFEDIKKYPIVGRGMFELTFYDRSEVAVRHNGLTTFISRFGIIGSIIYFSAIFHTLLTLVRRSELNSFLSVIFFIEILGMGIAEAYFEKPYFWGLVFLHLVVRAPVEEPVAIEEMNKTHA